MENISLTQFLNNGNEHRDVDPELILVLHDIVSACKKIAQAVNKGALNGQMGSLDSENVQGETQKQLDVIADEIFLEFGQASGYVAGMVSEELDDPFTIPADHRKHGKYLLLFDPLDGSSNVNVNISVGTIFSVLKMPDHDAIAAVEDFLQPGKKQICAGYALYGSSTMLVFTTGNGVNGFTLDHESDEFFLTHPAMEIPQDTQEFAINMSNQRFWKQPVQRYIEECLQGAEGVRKKDFNMRWVASMVAEVHRILIRGGVFIYPVDRREKGHTGKLRLMYEANPMAFIVEQSGGAAANGLMRILDIAPEHIHQRVPVMLGSKNEVERLVQYHQSENQAD